MPPKRESIGKSTPNARKAKTIRNSETNEQRDARAAEDRSRHAQSRAYETDEQQQARTAADRSRTARTRRTIHADLKLGAFQYNADYDYSQHPSVDIGKMEKLCVHCDAFKFQNETPGMCCANGKVKLPKLRPPPEPLLSLLLGESTS